MCKRNEAIEKILIIGPNGNVGQRLIPKLIAMGYKVRALEYRSKVPERKGQEVVSGHTLDIESIKKAMDGVDAVCHMIRATGPGNTKCEKWFNCCLKGTLNLLETAKDLKLTRFINGSADNVFGHTTMSHEEYGPINENHPKRFADGYYGLFKILEEEMCRQYFLGFAVPTVITRFAMIRDENTASFSALDKQNQNIHRFLDINGKSLVRHDTDIEDAVQGILLALEKDEAVGEDFIFADKAPYSYDTIADILSEKYNWPIIDKETGFNPWSLDISKARQVLGYRPKFNSLRWLDTL